MKDNKIILFDGTNFNLWKSLNGGPADWILSDGCMTVGKTCIVSTVEYGDAQLHVEFRCPDMPEATGQGKGNSGVFVHGSYEIQVLDSYGVENYTFGDCGSVYSYAKSLFNASLPAEEWQTYDIYFRAPRFDADGNITEKARLTLIHNGICIHNNLILERTTPGGVTGEIRPRGPLMLQEHGNAVSFRNIWIRPLD